MHLAHKSSCVPASLNLFQCVGLGGWQEDLVPPLSSSTCGLMLAGSTRSMLAAASCSWCFLSRGVDGFLIRMFWVANTSYRGINSSCSICSSCGGTCSSSSPTHRQWKVMMHATQILGSIAFPNQACQLHPHGYAMWHILLIISGIPTSRLIDRSEPLCGLV